MNNITYIELTESEFMEDKLALIKNMYPTEFHAKSQDGSIIILKPNSKEAVYYIDVSSKLTEQDMEDLKTLCSNDENIHELYKLTANRVNIKEYLTLKMQNNVPKLLEYIRAEKTYLEKNIVEHGEAIYHKDIIEEVLSSLDNFNVEYDSTKLTGKIVLSSTDVVENYKAQLMKWSMIYEIFYYKTAHPILNREVVLDGESYFVPTNKLTMFVELLRDYI